MRKQRDEFCCQALAGCWLGPGHAGGTVQGTLKARLLCQLSEGGTLPARWGHGPGHGHGTVQVFSWGRGYWSTARTSGRFVDEELDERTSNVAASSDKPNNFE